MDAMTMFNRALMKVGELVILNEDLEARNENLTNALQQVVAERDKANNALQELQVNEDEDKDEDADKPSTTDDRG